MLGTRVNVKFIQIISVESIYIIRYYPKDFSKIKTSLYYRYLLRGSTIFNIVILIEGISYIVIYNVSVWLLAIVKVTKVKVISFMKCVRFVDVLHRRRGGIPLRLMQWNVYMFGGVFITRFGTIRVYDVELALRHRKLMLYFIFIHVD